MGTHKWFLISVFSCTKEQRTQLIISDDSDHLENISTNYRKLACMASQNFEVVIVLIHYFQVFGMHSIITHLVIMFMH